MFIQKKLLGRQFSVSFVWVIFYSICKVRVWSRPWLGQC